MGLIEDKLCETMAEVIGLDDYRINDNFITKGGNIALATQVVDKAKIEGLTPQLVMMGLTPNGIAEVLKEKGGRKPTFTIGEATEDEYPMTPSMLYNYFCCEATGETIDAMDLKALWDLNDDVDLERLIEAIKKSVNHYPGLNIGFNREKAVFTRRETKMSDIQILELTEDGLREFLAKAGSRRRNMEEDNMVDSTIIKFNGKAYLYLRMPHLVYDGMSTNVLLKNITQCYSGGNPVDEIATIFDEGNYQKKVMESSFYDEALQYYDEILKEYPTDFRKEMKDDYFTYFFNEKIGQLSEANYKKFLKENGLTFGILLQASFVLAISKDLKKDKLIYRLFHSGRYNMILDNLQGTEARPVLMLADFKNDERVVDFLQKLQYQYFESVYYDVVPFTKMIKRYPDIDSGIVFNYRGNLLGNTDIVLDGKPNSFSVLGYIYGSDSKDAGHSHDIFDMMLDKTSDGYAMSGNSGYYSKEEVLKIVEDMKVAFNLFLEKETIGQVLEAMDK